MSYVYQGEFKAEIMRGGGERITVVEMSGISDMDRGARKEQMTTY